MADLATKIQNALVTQITAECQTAISDTDPTYARQVTTGRFQDDPTDYGVVIRVHRNHPKKTSRSGRSAWPDERLPTEMGAQVIGGAVVGGSPEEWWRRFTIVCHVWPAGKTQTEAQAVNGDVIARLELAIRKLVLNGLSDDYGEAISDGTNPITQVQCDEGGGPDDEYSWTTQLYLQYQTYKSIPS
jgi:hypothetical protein